jgi:hypothetical protein
MKYRYAIQYGLALLALFFHLPENTAEAASAPVIFHASLRETTQAPPARKGSVVATLDGNALRIVGFFEQLSAPWYQVELYLGDPEDGGELVVGPPRRRCGPSC